MNFSLVPSTKLMGILFPEAWRSEVIDNPLSLLGSHGVVNQNLEQACQREYSTFLICTCLLMMPECLFPKLCLN